MKKKKILLFSNCHGVAFKRILHEHLSDNIHITHVLTYENLTKIKYILHEMDVADIIIMTPFQNSESVYHFKNIKQFIDTNKIIYVPYIRFDGFFPENSNMIHMKKNKIKNSCVTWIPDISANMVDVYIAGGDLTDDIIHQHYNKHVDKMRRIESQSDINFINHFSKTYQHFMTFKDTNHPVSHIFKHVCEQLCEIITQKYTDICQVKPISKIILPVIYEHGHYRLIKDCVRDVLNIKYDLDQSYMISRKKFLTDIINYEKSNSQTEEIHTLDQLYEKVFHIRRTDDRRKATSLNESNISLPFMR